jgi:predicted transglutaminase-like cysteine proteinase
MAIASYQELARKKEELAARLGPTLRPDGFAEFSQLVEKACELRDTDRSNAERLYRRAEEMLPQVEKSVESALSLRDQIKTILMAHADEAMVQYHDALKELSK